MEWADVLRAAGAFALVLVSLTLAFALIRLAAALQRTTELLASLDREALPAIGKVNALLDGATHQMVKVDAMLETAVDGVQSADRTVRRVGAAVEKPLGTAAEGAAFVSGFTSSFRARRDERRALGGAQE
jgi:hypothetical protein